MVSLSALSLPISFSFSVSTPDLRPLSHLLLLSPPGLPTTNPTTKDDGKLETNLLESIIEKMSRLLELHQKGVKSYSTKEGIDDTTKQLIEANYMSGNTLESNAESAAVVYDRARRKTDGTKRGRRSMGRKVRLAPSKGNWCLLFEVRILTAASFARAHCCGGSGDDRARRGRHQQARDL